jgi:tetratricopeptide (TPR) repeat protein
MADSQSDIYDLARHAQMLAAAGRLAEAADCWRHPEESSSVNNLGSAYRGIGASAEAAVCYQQALRLRPDDVEVLVNLANAFGDLGDIEVAEAYARRAIALQPDLPNAHFALGWLLLTSGRLQEGWREHAWRRRMKDYVIRSFPGQEWQGEPPGDRLLLLHSDEGIGDAIQCVRYIPMLGASNVVLEVQPDLVRLFQGLPGVTAVLATGRSGTLPVDLHRPLLDLPGLLGTTVETIPSEVPYLQADPGLALKWHRRLEHLTGFRVGLAWAGNPANLADRTRSMALAQLTPLFDSFPEVAFVSLQKGAAGQQTGRPLHDFTADLIDFAETAALLQTLDLVIAVDTAVVHLAGALGMPVWLLNRFDTDWRWMLGRDDSPWYPTLRQFRQPEMGDWDAVVSQVAAALRQHLAEY